jgi:hypothetical protein
MNDLARQAVVFWLNWLEADGWDNEHYDTFCDAMADLAAACGLEAELKGVINDER